MQVYFVPAPECPHAPTNDEVFAFLLERPRYVKEELGVRYENADTGAQHRVSSTGPSGLGAGGRERLRISFSMPPIGPAAFAREAADEIAALTERFQLHISPTDATADRPWSRKDFLAHHAAELRTTHVRRTEKGEIDPPRLAAWTLDHIYTFNAQLEIARTWLREQGLHGYVPRIQCVKDERQGGHVGTAVVWNEQTRILPEVDWLMVLDPNGAGLPHSVSLASCPAIKEELGYTKSHSETMRVLGKAYDVGVRHWVLTDEKRARLNTIVAQAQSQSPALEIVPWLRIATADIVADAVLLPLFERMSRGMIDPTFKLTWTSVSAHMPTFTSVRGDGTVERFEGQPSLGTVPEREVIGHAGKSDLARLGKALVDSHFPYCKKVLTHHGPVGEPASACNVSALGHGMHFVMELSFDSEDFDRLRETVWSIFGSAEGRTSPSTTASSGAPTYGSCYEAINDFLQARGHAWRLELMAASSHKALDPSREPTFTIRPPSGYKQVLTYSVSWHLQMNWKKRTLIITESEDKGSDYRDIVTEPIDDVWLARFCQVRWP